MYNGLPIYIIYSACSVIVMVDEDSDSRVTEFTDFCSVKVCKLLSVPQGIRYWISLEMKEVYTV